MIQAENLVCMTVGIWNIHLVFSRLTSYPEPQITGALVIEVIQKCLTLEFSDSFVLYCQQLLLPQKPRKQSQ